MPSGLFIKHDPVTWPQLIGPEVDSWYKLAQSECFHNESKQMSLFEHSCITEAWKL